MEKANSFVARLTSAASATMGICLWLALAVSSLAQANGKLQIHFMDVGQGDAALLISPKGEIVLFDNGVSGKSELPISYMQQLGVDHIDYHIASHYHNDHIGNTVQVFAEFPLRKYAFDRGGTYNSLTFDRYVATFGAQRKQALDGSSITLDKGTSGFVRIDFVASNGNGVQTSNENDMSLVSVVHFGKFDAVFGGDLSGVDANDYLDIETGVAAKLKEVEVYKVNHHGSRYSSNTAWLAKLHPKIGVISCGDGNVYKHPTAACLQRLHTNGIQKVYWTERGNGADPKPGQDEVAGNVIVEAEVGSNEFRVIHSGEKVDKYSNWDTPAAAAPDAATDPSGAKYAWSKASHICHYPNCQFVGNISPWNLQTGNAIPEGYQLHIGCPK